MTHSDFDIEQAEDLVASRCEDTVSRFLDFCEKNADNPVIWESSIDPWNFRVAFINGKWVMDDLELEIEGLEEYFEDDDLSSREGIDHVICSVLIPLGIEFALGKVPGRTGEEFLAEVENAVPRIDV